MLEGVVKTQKQEDSGFYQSSCGPNTLDYLSLRGIIYGQRNTLILLHILGFDKSTHLCNHHHNQDREIFCCSRNFSVSHAPF